MNPWKSARRFFLALGCTLAVWTLDPATAQADPGKERFTKICAACHTVGGGKLVGPDLKGVTERRDREWLKKFIKSSQSMVKSGDKVAVELFEEFNKVAMPDAPYSDEEIESVLKYIESASASGGGGGAAPIKVSESPADIAKGQDLFQGVQRLSNGGAACNSCHHVKNDAVIGGGVLAKELTSVFSTVGGAGVSAILGAPPFPVMEEAYKEHPLTEDEIVALIAFLQEADKQQAFQEPRDYGVKLFVSGIIGWAVLMGLFGLIWARRKKGSVNHDIYARQVKSR